MNQPMHVLPQGFKVDPGSYSNTETSPPLYRTPLDTDVTAFLSSLRFDFSEVSYDVRMSFNTPTLNNWRIREFWLLKDCCYAPNHPPQSGKQAPGKLQFLKSMRIYILSSTLGLLNQRGCTYLRNPC